MCYVRNREQLYTALGECETRFGGAVIEEYIPGGVEATKTVVLLFSPQSRLIAAFTTRKIRQWPETGGITAVSRSTADEHLVKLVLPFFQKWRWCGVAEVELKCDIRNGQDKVIESTRDSPGPAVPTRMRTWLGGAGGQPGPRWSSRAECYFPQLVNSSQLHDRRQVRQSRPGASGLPLETPFRRTGKGRIARRPAGNVGRGSDITRPFA